MVLFYTTVVSRIAGEGVASFPNLFPEILLAIPLVLLIIIKSIVVFPAILFFLIWYIIALMMQIGHVSFYTMTIGNYFKPNYITAVLDFLRVKRDTFLYSWLGLGIKAFLIILIPFLLTLQLPLLAFIVAMPFAYFVGNWWIRGKTGAIVSEMLRGLFLGICVVMCL